MLRLLHERTVMKNRRLVFHKIFVKRVVCFIGFGEFFWFLFVWFGFVYLFVCFPLYSEC